MAAGPRLRGVRAVVTGGSRGLGRAVVGGLVAAGADVVATATGPAGLAALPEGARGVTLDLGDPASVDACAAEVAALFGGVDLLVNNAGVLGFRGALLDAPPDDIARTIAVNLTGTLRLTRALRGALAPGAAVVNVSSGAAARPGWAGYAVSKAGLDAASAVLRAELAGDGVRVIAVNPGGLRTEMRAAAYPGEDQSVLPRPESIVPLFVAIGAGEDPGGYVDAREWIA